MHILVINPNSTVSMTDKVGKAAEAAARQGTKITAINPPDTPPAIQGPEDGAAALPGLFRLFDEKVLAEGGYDACIIACFDDTGLLELKRRAPIPVIGIGEAAFHAAMLVGQHFSIVTTLAVSKPVIEKNLRLYGVASRCMKVRASEVPVLELEHNPAAACNRIAVEMARAISEEGPDAFILGCAGMADLAAQLSETFSMPVIDGVAAAVAFAESLHAIGVDAWLKAGPVETDQTERLGHG